MVTFIDVCALARTLPRSKPALVYGRVKFRIGSIVYLAFSRDQQIMGFAFPKEQRDWLIGGSPDKFLLPSSSDLRYHWVHVRLHAIDADEMRSLVLDAWRFVVPKSVAAAYASDTAIQALYARLDAEYANLHFPPALERSPLQEVRPI